MNNPHEQSDQPIWAEPYDQHLNLSLSGQDETDIKQTLCEFFKLLDTWDQGKDTAEDDPESDI
jgi:hypothetical protein